MIASPQVYGIGIKELWDIPAEKHVPGKRHPHARLAIGRRLGGRLPLPPG